MLHYNLQLVGFVNTIFNLIFYEIKLTQFGSNKKMDQIKDKLNLFIPQSVMSFLKVRLPLKYKTLDIANMEK